LDAAPIKAPSRRSLDEIVAQVHTTVLEREMVLRDSKWAIAAARACWRRRSSWWIVSAFREVSPWTAPCCWNVCG
jgi:hypothetical protein